MLETRADAHGTRSRHGPNATPFLGTVGHLTLDTFGMMVLSGGMALLMLLVNGFVAVEPVSMQLCLNIGG